MRRILAAAILALPLSAYAWPLKPFTATYDFDIDHRLHGSATRALERINGNAFRYTFTANAPLATAAEVSNFLYDGDKVTSQGYTRDFHILFISKHTAVNFDWPHHLASTDRDGKPEQYLIKPGTLDELNLEIQVRRDMVETGHPSSYWLGNPKNLSPLQLGIVGEEIMDTPIGKLHVVKIRRTNGDADRETTFWLARELDFAPAKVMQNDKGAIYTISITGYKGEAGEKLISPAAHATPAHT